MTGRYWLETLGCPKNEVDSEKLAGLLEDQGLSAAPSPHQADTIVVNTCAFIEAARRESIDTILELADGRREGARLVVTGCLAERYGEELARSLPEVDLVAGFGADLLAPDAPDALHSPDATAAPHAPDASERPHPSNREEPVPVTLRTSRPPSFDLLNLPRPAHRAPWAYVKVAEGCDRECGFCAIPSFRGRQRSRSLSEVLHEVEDLGEGVREVVLVAQDLASWAMDKGDMRDKGGRRAASSRAASSTGRRARPIVELVRHVSERVDRVRLLYLYPSALDDDLIEAVAATGVPYFDLSLQHVSRPLVKRMRRFGESSLFLDKIERIRQVAPEASLRSSFILGYPGETEEDQDLLLEFIERAELDWAGFFTFSKEDGTYAAGLDAPVPPALAMERLRECAEVQDRITRAKRCSLVGQELEVLVDRPSLARSYREAPEIDGVVHVPSSLEVGELHRVTATGAAGPELWAEPVGTSRARGGCP